MAHQCMPKIFNDPNKSPLTPLLYTSCTVNNISEHMTYELKYLGSSLLLVKLEASIWH